MRLSHDNSELLIAIPGRRAPRNPENGLDRRGVQFPDLLERPRVPLFASAIFQSKFARYFYWACAPGWALGIWLLRGRSWTLTLAAAVSAVSLSAYIAAYLYLSGNWWLPLPIYIEHVLFALFWTAAIAAYGAGCRGLGDNLLT